VLLTVLLPQTANSTTTLYRNIVLYVTKSIANGDRKKATAFWTDIAFVKDGTHEQERASTLNTQTVDGRRCGVVRSKSAGTERLSTGLKQLTEDGEAGVGRQRALSITFSQT